LGVEKSEIPAYRQAGEYRAKRPFRTNPKQIRIFKIQILEALLFRAFEIWSFDIVSNFACLREAASAKAGISCFGFRRN